MADFVDTLYGTIITAGILTFKENCPDVRNSKVVDVIRELKKYGARVDATIRGWIRVK